MIRRLHSSTSSPKRRAQADEPRVDSLHRAGLAAVDEDAVDQVQELVAVVPATGPAVRQMLAGRQDLLGHHVEVARGSGRALRAQPRLQAPEVLGGRVEPVGVIDPQAGHACLRPPAGRRAVGLLEDRGHLHANGGQLVDVEEPPVVDLLAGHAPVRHAIGLLASRPSSRSKLGGSPAAAVEAAHVVLDELPHGRRLVEQRGRRALDRSRSRAAALASLRSPVSASRAGSWWTTRCSDLSSSSLRVLGAQPLAAARPGGGRGCARRSAEPGAAVLVVADAEARRSSNSSLSCPALEHRAVLIAQDRQQDLVRPARP